jgi:hypothetical protein
MIDGGFWAASGITAALGKQRILLIADEIRPVPCRAIRQDRRFLPEQIQKSMSGFARVS